MGVYSNEPDPPEYYAVVETKDCVRYTDPTQSQWFMDRINYAYSGTATNVRMDGDTIRWFGYYRLDVGDWLWGGTTPITDEVLRASTLRPVPGTWPDSTGATTTSGA